MTQHLRLLGQAIAVHDLDAAVASFERIGLTMTDRIVDRDGGVTIARLPFADGGYLDLVRTDDANRPSGATVEAFLHSGGDGMFRVDLAVEGLAELGSGSSPVGATEAPPVWLSDVTEAPDGSLYRAVDLADPTSVGGAGFHLVDAASVPESIATGTWWERIYNQAVAVPTIDRAIATFQALNQELWDRSGREEWGLDTAVFRQASGSAVEFVSPADTTLPTGAAVQAFLQRRGGGHYMPVYEVADVDEVFARLEAAGVRTLGPPSVTPPESPWGELRQMWVHPKLTHGAFVEFLTVPR
jgi:hypothetical protein